jgi:hypothetical protein
MELWPSPRSATPETTWTKNFRNRAPDARALARTSMEKAAGGNNPVIAKRVEAARVAGGTVKAAVDRYLAHCDRNLKPKTAKEWRRIFEHDEVGSMH